MDSNFLLSAPWGPIPQAPQGYSWDSLMELALEQAKLGALQNEIPVGAIIVDIQGNIVAKAHNKSIQDNDPTAHAEILVIRKAGQIKKNYRLSDCYLIVTLEPCFMCMGAIREARLAGVVFGAYDNRAGAICSCYEGLYAPQLGVKTWHYGGILSQHAVTILQNFFIDKR